jgi:phosphatidylserine/phosphatidylglycerophosphate/cardiolipin synthase-like enzyme
VSPPDRRQAIGPSRGESDKILRRNLHVGVLVLAMCLGLLATGPSTAAAAGRYDPPSGVLFNNPLGTTAERQAIFQHLLRAVKSSPKNSKIRMATWNFKSPRLTDALVDAHRRGVSVRITMSRGNANAENPNPNYDRLNRVFSTRANAKRPEDMTSWIRRCSGSCRGAHGIAHTKVYLFSKVGPARNVMMFGSANATDASARYQWNDMFTVKERPALWKRWEQILAEMGNDKPLKAPFARFGSPRFTAMVYPFTGRTAPKTDVMLTELRRIRCAGAVNAGVRGKTSIRIAQTAWTDERGMALAQRVRSMWDRGCDFRVIYAMMGTKIYHYLRSPKGRGPVPMAHIVQDWNLDGIYDRYLHTKVMTVSGVYGDNPSANFTWNGSSNWTSKSLRSDEELFRIEGRAVRRQYARWIDQVFSNPPPRPELDSTTMLRRSIDTRAVDPYAHMEIN